MSKIKNENYFVIQGWMINTLNLKGVELLVYAIIRGFSQDTESYFTGSLQYLADFTNSSKNGVVKALSGLTAKGLIEKQEVYINNVKLCRYRTTELYGGIQLGCTGYTTELYGGIQLSCTNNIYNNNNINNNKEGAPQQEPAAKPSKFEKPTQEDVERYCWEKNIKNVDAGAFIDHYESNGWKVGGRGPMKDWKAAVRNWSRHDFSSGKKNRAGLFGQENACADKYKDYL